MRCLLTAARLPCLKRTVPPGRQPRAWQPQQRGVRWAAAAAAVAARRKGRCVPLSHSSSRLCSQLKLRRSRRSLHQQPCRRHWFKTRSPASCSTRHRRQACRRTAQLRRCLTTAPALQRRSLVPSAGLPTAAKLPPLPAPPRGLAARLLPSPRPASWAGAQRR
jgi:hypothetical protein